MPITPTELRQSVEILRELGATRILLFGSAAASPETARDLDLACEGIPPEHFFLAAGRLLQALATPVDLLDLTKNTRRNQFIRNRAKILYET